MSCNLEVKISAKGREYFNIQNTKVVCMTFNDA